MARYLFNSLTVLGTIPASSDTVECEGRQMKQCLKVHKKQKNTSVTVTSVQETSETLCRVPPDWPGLELVGDEARLQAAHRGGDQSHGRSGAVLRILQVATLLYYFYHGPNIYEDTKP
jgi:hypothetical protein